MKKQLLVCLASLLLQGCATTVGARYDPPDAAFNSPRDIFIALDGTGNNQLSRTNVSRLYELVDNANVNRPRATYYGEGVGTDARFIGAATGWGIGHDVRGAYDFLIEHWRPGDRIFLTGFSRGAYTARILAGLVAIAGVPDLTKYSADQRAKKIKQVYDAYKTERGSRTLAKQNADRLAEITQILAERPANAGGGVTIEAMALWDTVEALGTPDGTDDFIEDLDQYFLTTCNVNAVFHAVSLDDNRAYSFTPISVHSTQTNEACPDWHPRVEEVWFAGAHADVGGSYSPGGRTDGYMPGVSLNWMLSRLREYKLFDYSTRAFADPFGPIHDAKAYTSAYRILYRRRREPLRYSAQTGMNAGKPYIHDSAVQRLERLKALDNAPQCKDRTLKPRLFCSSDFAPHDPEGNEVGFVGEMVNAKCLEETQTGFRLTAEQNCITVVTDEAVISPTGWGTPWRLSP